jgi:hypothetical protein
MHVGNTTHSTGQPVMGDDDTSVMSRLRIAAVNATEAMIAYHGNDPAELVALAQQIGLRENCTAECTKIPTRPGMLKVRYHRAADGSP